MTVQYTITVGEIVTLAIFLIGAVAAVIAIKIDVAVMKEQMKSLRDLIAPMREWWDESVHGGRSKSDDELVHDLRGIENVLKLRAAVRERAERTERPAAPPDRARDL